MPSFVKPKRSSAGLRYPGKQPNIATCTIDRAHRLAGYMQYWLPHPLGFRRVGFDGPPNLHRLAPRYSANLYPSGGPGFGSSRTMYNTNQSSAEGSNSTTFDTFEEKFTIIAKFRRTDTSARFTLFHHEGTSQGINLRWNYGSVIEGVVNQGYGVTSTLTLGANETYTVVFSGSDSILKMWVNGIFQAENSSIAFTWPTSHRLNLLASNATNANAGEGWTEFITFIPGYQVLSDEEARDWTNDPYQGLKDASLTRFYDVISAGATALIVQDISQAQTIDVVSLTQHNALASNDIDQAQALDEPTLTQHNMLTSADINQAQAIDSSLIVQHHILTVTDIDQAQTIDVVSLTQHNALSTNDIDQAQTIDNVTLAVTGALVTQDIDQAQTIDNAALIQHAVLLVNELSQAQAIDNTTLTPDTLMLVNDISQAQGLDVSTLIQHGIITVQDISQAQALDNVSFGGAVVVSNLDGSITIYLKLAGGVTLEPAIDGAVELDPATDGETNLIH